MKIKKQATARHESTISPMIADFVKATESIPLYQIPAHLAAFPKLWPFPRGDLYHWIPVLNRFDRILELFNTEYGLVDGPQTQPFQRRLLLKGDADEGSNVSKEVATDAILDGLQAPADGDRELIEHILAFTRLLLENCGNRSLYSSSAHLDKLLNTTSYSLLKATLRLSLRLAQRYHAARMRLAPASLHPTLLASHYNFNLDNILKLAAPLAKRSSGAAPLFATPAGKGKEKTLGTARQDTDKVNSADLTALITLPDSILKQEFGSVNISYYDQTTPGEDDSARPGVTDSPATPTPARRTSNLRPDQTPSRQGQTPTTSDSPVTPSLGPDTASRNTGQKFFYISPETVASTDIHELLKRSLGNVPETSHYELLLRTRIAHSLTTHKNGREDNVSVRLLAIANLGYVYGDKDFYHKIGQQDADEPRRLQLAYQLAELAHPPGHGETGASRELQALALSTLEAMAKHKQKAPDVCAALSVNVNHGVLFYVVRKAVAELGTDDELEDTVQDEWREALFSLLNTLPTCQARTGEGMVAAGLLEILVEVLTLRTKKAERNQPKVLQFLDTFVHNLRDAFSALVAAKGLDIIADLTAYEVDTSKKLAEEGRGMPKEYKTQLTDYEIPFYHQQTLRWLFKFMNHMMSHTGGNFERLLRNLIDSPQLLGGLRQVLSHAPVYGSTVWSMAVNILTSFIHNEPTSYAVIAEAGLSEAFLDTVASETRQAEAISSSTSGGSPSGAGESQLAPGILPVAEAISTLPPAFGAICLAEAGMKLFQSSEALARFFEIFRSPAHVKALDADTEIASLIGASFDELVRHHPQLKDKVLMCLSDMIKHVVSLCSARAEKEGIGAKLWTEDDGTLLVAGGRKALYGPQGPIHEEITSSIDAQQEDVEMQDAPDHEQQVADEVGLSDIVAAEDKSSGPSTTQYINVVCRFLQGFFGNHTMCAAYVDAAGVESILDIATLPCLSPEVNDTHAISTEFGRVVQVFMEQKPHITIPAIIKRTQRALDRLQPLMDHPGKEAFFAPFTNATPSLKSASPAMRENLQRGTEYVKSLVTIHTFVYALTMTFQGQTVRHGSSHNFCGSVNLADMYARLVESLGRLHRRCVWEEILLQQHMPTEWEKDTRIRSFGFGQTEADNILRLAGSDSANARDEGIPGDAQAEAGRTEPPESLSHNSARFKNTQSLRFLLSKVTTDVAPFYQSLGKLLLFRRSPEPYQKQSATLVADQIAQAAIGHLQLEAPRQSDSVHERYAYLIVILTSLSQLMIESSMGERNNHALTLILVSFRNLGGLAVLAETFNAFYETASTIIQKPTDTLKDSEHGLLNLALGGLKIILTFYAQIVNSKTIGEASQTTSLQSRSERSSDRADHFMTAQFLVELRHAVIEPVQKIWNSELMDKATTSIVKTSISILKTVLDGETEHGACRSKDKIVQRLKPTIKPWKPRSQESVQRLKDAGFDEDLALEALYRCCDNFNAAREYCQNQTRITRASRNPIPTYETEVRATQSATPNRAEVVVPEAADNASAAASEDSESEDSDAEETHVADMEDVQAPPTDNAPATHTSVPEVASAEQHNPEWDFLAYRKRIHVGNAAEPVTLDELDEQRNVLRTNLVDRSLDILNSHDDVTFELADLICAAVQHAADPATMRTDIGSTLVQSLISLQTGEDFRPQGKKIAASAHFLALILQEKDFYEAIVSELKEVFSMLLEFIKIFPDTPPEESPWVGQVLLIVERLLAEDQLPHIAQWTPPKPDNKEDVAVEDLPEPTVSFEEKSQLFDAILEVLPRIGKDESMALSVTRVLVMLTRSRRLAMRLSEKRNIQRLFLMVRQLAGITNEGLRSAFMIVLRHIVEDENIMRQFMRSEIQTMFEQRDRRQTDTTAYTRQMYHLALRDPQIFVEVTNEKLHLARYDDNQRPQVLVLKKNEDAAGDEAAADPEASNTSSEQAKDREQGELKRGPLVRTKTADLKVPVVENSDGVIHYLLCELLAYKEVDDTGDASKPMDLSGGAGKQPEQNSSTRDAPSDNSSLGNTTEPAKNDKVEFKAEAHPIYIYRCFILKCLAELLQSYNRTKIEFINFSRKADPHALTPSKPRSGVLNYLLSSLVPTGSLNHEGDLAFKKKSATSGCAIEVIVALCSKTGENKQSIDVSSPYVETETDLLFVRKFVLEHSLKAFKDASTCDENLDMKYSRLLNIADIFSKMISQRQDGQMLSQNAELTPALKQMAKIMYEKNFITILTTAIADIDLNFPNAKRAVKYILKPLKWLCSVAVDLSTHYDASSAPDASEEYEISSASDDDMVGNTREETPDLFRNSTLGMYEPNNESESEPSDDEDDEEMYDEAFADDMDYDEELPDDDVVSDEDEEMGDMGPIEGMPGDGMPLDVEVILDEDVEDMGSDDEDDSDGESIDDEEDVDDDDEDDDDDEEDDDEMDHMVELDEITGDGENASLADDGEGSWSGDDEDFGDGVGMMPTDIPPGLGFVLDPPLEQLDPMQQIRNLDGDLDEFMEDDMQEEDDEDDDGEEDYDDQDIVFQPGLEDDEDGMGDMGWGWDEPQPPAGMRHTHRMNEWMFPGGPGDRILVPAYRSHRPGAAPRITDDGVNPLLQRMGRPSGRHLDASLPGNRSEGSDWVHAIERRLGSRAFPGDGPVSFISNLISAMSQGGGPTLHQHNGALHLSFDNHLPLGLPSPFGYNMRNDMLRMREPGMSRPGREDPQSAVAFNKAFTTHRWQEEARILYGVNAIEKSTRVVNSILKLIVPPAIEAQEKRKAEREAFEAERRRKEQEERERKEREEREAREAKEREEQEQRDREAAEAQAHAAEHGAGVEVTGDDQTMEDVSGVDSTGQEAAQAGPSEDQPRVTINVRGREVDITALGIDRDYLDALPEELREEVLMQQITEQRSQQQTQSGSGNDNNNNNSGPSAIDEDFLGALPPEIREELLAQEAQDRRRREREEARRRNAASGGARAEDMDPASFLASLDPQLRAAVLMEQDEDVLRLLPPEISAEARAYGGDRRLNQLNDYLPSGYRRGGDRRAAQEDPSQRRKARPCVQMLDKSGVATLLRLMFIPQQGSAKASLSQILRNVCENRQNRAEVISILLSILQDGSADVNAVERSFAQLSLRAKQPQQGADKTPKASRKSGALSINVDVSPLMVVQQCLQTLWQLTDKNPPVWSFFLTEHETAVNFKNRASRKGKGKESKSTRYPLNALLSLLDRKLIIESSSIMEQLTMLLRVITGPLQVIKKQKEKEKEAEAEQDTAAPAAGQETLTAGEASSNVPENPAVATLPEDTDMASAPPTAQDTEAQTAQGSAAEPGEKKSGDDKSKKHRSLAPPDVPENNLRLVAKILAARECNSKVFQETLSVISNLSPIPGAKETFGKELLGIAQDLALSTLQDLANLTVQITQASTQTDVQGMALSKFSPPSSDQAKLLRALTALDYLFDPTRDSSDKPGRDAEALEPAQKEDILRTLYENPTFGGLWKQLSECLAVIRERGNMLNIATILLPLIEALMVVCKNTTLKDVSLAKMVAKEFALSSPPPENPMENLFFNFTEDHRKILNDLVRQNPKLMSGTFSLLVKNSKVLEFDNKRNYFNRKLHTRTNERERVPHPPLQLAVRRDQVFLDSFKSLYFKSPDEMKYGKLSIRFHGEEGVDAGGVTREWFQAISRQMFNPDYALFIPVASDRTTFHPNRLSAINQEHLMFFKFIGRIIGKALYENRVLDCHFSRAVYKRLLGKSVNLKDMETLDLEYYKSLQWMLENDITDIITETFSVDVEAFGVTQTVDLIENGRNVPVTEENKQEYVRLVTEHRLTGAVQEQLEHFLEGFHSIVPAELVAIFSEQELELLISGLPDISVDDWKNNTEYHNYTAASPQIQWFWRAVRSFDKEERAKLLQFVTGTSKVPLNGFKELEGMNGFSRFNIHRDYGNKDRLPSSHTCFNQLDLPEYDSYEDLRKAVYIAMTAGGEYFGFA